MAADGEDRIGIEADFTDHVSKPAERAARAVDDLGDESKTTERRLAALQRQADKTGFSLEFLAVQSRAAGMSFSSEGERVSWIADEFRRLTDQAKKATRATEDLERKTRRADGSFRGFLRTMGRVRGMVGGTTRALFGLGAGLAVVAVASGATQLVGGIFGIVGALASLIAVSALIPAAVGSGVAIIGALALATWGLSDAISAAASGDWEKFATDMEKLSPAARSLVLQIVELLPELKRFQRMVQENVLRPLQRGLTRVFINLWPVLWMGMDRVSRALGGILDEILLFLSSAPAAAALEALLDGATDLLHGLRGAIAPLGQGLADVIVKALPYWDRFIAALSGGLGRFGTWLSQISADGRLDRWLDMAFQTASDLWSILWSVVRIVGALAKAGSGDVLGNIAGALDKFATFLNTPVAQNGMQKFFDALPDITTAVGVLAAAMLVMSSPKGVALALAVSAIVAAIALFKPELKEIIDTVKKGFGGENGEGFRQFKETVKDLVAEWLPKFRKFLQTIIETLKDPEVQDGLRKLSNFVSEVVLPVIGFLIFAVGVGLVGAFTVLIGVLSLIGKALAIAAGHIRDTLKTVFSFVDGALGALTEFWDAMPGGEGKAAELRASRQRFNEWADGVIAKLDEIARPRTTKITGIYDPPETIHPNAPEGGGRWMGGRVGAGINYNVGELGKELYVPDSGTPSLIGVGGQERRSFPGDGTIIPNHLLNAHAEDLAARNVDPGPRVSAGTTVVHEGDTITIPVYAVDGMSARDVAREVEKVIADLKRDEQERR